MTVVLPSVSTAGRRRTMAWRCAMRLTPIASAIVTAAGSPSGMAPTARATAATSISDADSPRTVPTRTVTPASPRMTTVRTRLKRASLRVSGVARSVVSPSRRWMRPSSVSGPVVTTTPVPCPAVTSVPEKTMFARSASTDSGASTACALPTGTDSPVSEDSSICSSETSTSRTSALTLSPGSTTTRSPGTSSLAGTSRLVPSRTTCASTVIIAASASRARSARASCTNPTAAFAITTPRITDASTGSPTRYVTAAATSKT